MRKSTLSCFALMLIPCSFIACKSGGARGTRAEESTHAADSRAQTAAPADAGWDLNCVFDRLQNPTDAFHYSYKHNDDSWDADVSPTAIDGARTGSGGSTPIHGTRADMESWRMAGMSLSAISGMSSTLALVRNAQQATRREGHETVNGFDATRYSIDTTRADSVESGLYRATLGAGGWEKGTIWAGPQGCPVKLVLDVEMRLNDGSVSKDHYEEALVRK